MTWDDAETALVSFIRAEWAASSFAGVPLLFDNENIEPADSFVYVSIEGVYAEKTLYGSAGHRSSLEYGMVFYHAFVPTGSGKRAAVRAVQTMTQILELRTIASSINVDGGNPPSPVEYGREVDRAVPRAQPSGDFFRCSGSVPFCVLDTR